MAPAALNMAYFDLAYVVFALLAVLRNHAAERLAERPRENLATITAHAAAA